jgi:hypothetical protein
MMSIRFALFGLIALYLLLIIMGMQAMTGSSSVKHNYSQNDVIGAPFQISSIFP